MNDDNAEFWCSSRVFCVSTVVHWRCGRRRRILGQSTSAIPLMRACRTTRASERKVTHHIGALALALQSIDVSLEALTGCAYLPLAHFSDSCYSFPLNHHHGLSILSRCSGLGTTTGACYTHLAVFCVLMASSINLGHLRRLDISLTTTVRASGSYACVWH